MEHHDHHHDCNHDHEHLHEDCCSYWNYATYAILTIFLLKMISSYLPKKNLKFKGSNGEKVRILITGGAQGIGKHLAELITLQNKNDIQLIILDINQQLGQQTVQELQQITGIIEKNIRFLAIDISDQIKLEEAWKIIIHEFGYVNILVNNAARVIGKRFKDMAFKDFERTMQINFLPTVQLTKLFLSQPQLIQSQTRGQFHLVNVNSIAGHISSAFNSDYSAGKFALHGFTSSLRQEMIDDYPKLVMTNIYPYHVNTGMFEGFNPRLSLLIPTLDQKYVAKRIYEAICENEAEVYVWWYIIYIKMICDWLPYRFIWWFINFSTSDGMKTFKGRSNYQVSIAEKKNK
eukprot:403344264